MDSLIGFYQDASEKQCVDVLHTIQRQSIYLMQYWMVVYSVQKKTAYHKQFVSMGSQFEYIFKQDLTLKYYSIEEMETIIAKVPKTKYSEWVQLCLEISKTLHRLTGTYFVLAVVLLNNLREPGRVEPDIISMVLHFMKSCEIPATNALRKINSLLLHVDEIRVAAIHGIPICTGKRIELISCMDLNCSSHAFLYLHALSKKYPEVIKVLFYHVNREIATCDIERMVLTIYNYLYMWHGVYASVVISHLCKYIFKLDTKYIYDYISNLLITSNNRFIIPPVCFIKQKHLASIAFSLSKIDKQVEHVVKPVLPCAEAIKLTSHVLKFNGPQTNIYLEEIDHNTEENLFRIKAKIISLCSKLELEELINFSNFMQEICSLVAFTCPQVWMTLANCLCHSGYGKTYPLFNTILMKFLFNEHESVTITCVKTVMQLIYFMNCVVNDLFVTIQYCRGLMQLCESKTCKLNDNLLDNCFLSLLIYHSEPIHLFKFLVSKNIDWPLTGVARCFLHGVFVDKNISMEECISFLEPLNPALTMMIKDLKTKITSNPYITVTNYKVPKKRLKRTLEECLDLCSPAKIAKQNSGLVLLSTVSAQLSPL